VSSCITIWEREHAYKFTRWCDPPWGKHRQHFSQQLCIHAKLVEQESNFSVPYFIYCAFSKKKAITWIKYIYTEKITKHDMQGRQTVDLNS